MTRRMQEQRSHGARAQFVAGILGRTSARIGAPAVMVNGSANGKVGDAEVISTLRMMLASPSVACSMAK